MEILITWIVFLVALARFERHEDIREGVGLLFWEYYTPSVLRRFLNW
jgi:hypothetical protein